MTGRRTGSHSMPGSAFSPRWTWWRRGLETGKLLSCGLLCRWARPLLYAQCQPYAPLSLIQGRHQSRGSIWVCFLAQCPICSKSGTFEYLLRYVEQHLGKHLHLHIRWPLCLRLHLSLCSWRFLTCSITWKLCPPYFMETSGEGM